MCPKCDLIPICHASAAPRKWRDLHLQRIFDEALRLLPPPPYVHCDVLTDGEKECLPACTDLNSAYSTCSHR